MGIVTSVPKNGTFYLDEKNFKLHLATQKNFTINKENVTNLNIISLGIKIWVYWHNRIRLNGQ